MTSTSSSTTTDTTIAGFNLGDIVVHRVHNFRGVIVDVDADFQGSDDWYDQNTTNEPSKTAPWYHILIDEEGAMAYVSEQNIYTDSSKQEVDNPMIDDMFVNFDAGHYLPRQTLN